MLRAAALGLGILLLLSGGVDPAQALPRATTDRTDEMRGAQLHAIYAIPSDGTDRGLDTSGAIESSVASFQRWLADETGGATLRQDTFEGSLDVTFVRLPKTDAEIAARGVFVRDELEQLLRSAGLLVPDKLYAVYYDGSSMHSCGGGAWPPTLSGVIAAMYLRGRPPGAPPCESNSIAEPGAPPGYLDYAMLHELLHTLGAVPTCAPHHHLAGHVHDRPDDIMWAGTGSWQIPGRLDPGRDDYYGHGRTDCFDLARSPYLTSNSPSPRALTAERLTLGRARAGKIFAASLTVSLDGVPPDSLRATCSLRAAKRRPYPLVGQSLVRGRVTCRWRLPSKAEKQRLKGSIRVDVDGLSIARSFSVTVR